MMNREIAANLDAQQKQIDQMYAQDQSNIRGMQEQREVGDISALSSQYNAGNAMLWQGIGGIAQSGMSALGAGLGGVEKTQPELTSKVSGIQAQSPVNASVLAKPIMQQFQPQSQGITGGYGGSGLGGMNLQFDQFGNIISQ
jgi:hypothetical protein